MANQQVGSESGSSRSRRQPTSESNFQVPLVKENEDTYLNDYFVEAPGSLPGELKIPSDAYYPQIFLINYSETEATRTQIASLENCQEYLDDLDTVTWIDIQGLGSEEVLRQMGQIFNLNHLLLEDIVNIPQRPKIEEVENSLLVISRMVKPTSDRQGFISEQISFILGNQYLLTVQERPNFDTFNAVRGHIRNNRGQIRKLGADYLLYMLLDTAIDGFFPLLEDYSIRLEEISNRAIFQPNQQVIEDIFQIRQELLALCRAINPQRDKVKRLLRDRQDLISPQVQQYLQDCYEHSLQAIETAEGYRDLSNSLIDVYTSSVNNRTNNAMNFLTIVLSIYTPLAFITGLYGMNFNPKISPWNMPELNWYWGYPMALAIMGLSAMAMIIFFWRSGWFVPFKTFIKVLGTQNKKSGSC